ncbi:lipoprotein insertase outer membrane protein LolB [Pseudoalteromonas sp. APC 3358]|uniref:lipoprotein insertase outer membrane protein LolB n=1 Tax=Pseudoalteromonas sp. APC 3358 TaxID=3035176 RepID=UPI0025B31A0E|nr:lipoprotein insertase outer membrane protein LolB [Pseudoalteromonas sp. APC 3358]MDN3382088.1 lipoprotein insertase outer membrane protein LolB [Pseudoalteromonas sp. APC 3358]
MIRQYLILFMFFLLLGGCAHQIDTKTTLYDDWKPRLAAQETWQVEGKLAFISPEERQSANLNWQQTTNSNNLILTTFIGTRILSLKQTANGAELEFDGDEYFDTNAAELLKRLTGFTLPVDNADNWLKGTIDDQSLVVDELGRAKQVLWFDNAGKKWQIDYGTYVQNAGYWLPTKLTLKHQQIKIKIQLYDWQFK